MTQSRTGAEVIVEVLVQAGVRHVFGIVSIHNMPIVDAISRTDGIELITARHEQGAAHMADGYARATGGLGVVLGSTGPGTTNLATGIYEAAFTSSRLLAITGQAETAYYGKGRGYVHESENQLTMLRALTPNVASPRYVDDLAAELTGVIQRMLSGRPGPGVMEVPIDLQYASTGQEIPPTPTPSPVVPAADAIASAIELINTSQRRVIVAGGGTATPEAGRALTALAETLDAPVITTPNGKGAMASDHPLNMGVGLFQPQIKAAVKDADVMIAFGTRFEVGTNASKLNIELPPLIHVDVDPRMVGLNFKPAVGIVGDAGLVLEQLNAASLTSGDAQFTEQIRSIIMESRANTRERIGPDHASVMESLSKYLGPDEVFVRDSTIPGYQWGNALLPIDRPGGYVYPSSGAIGPGLPLGIGVAVATGRKTIIMHGDGGFMLHGTELATAAQIQAPIVVVIFNDGGYGVLRGLQANQFDGRFNSTELATPDFVKLAESMGVTGLHANDAEELEKQLKAAMAIDGPVLIELNANNMQIIEGIVPAPTRSP